VRRTLVAALVSCAGGEARTRLRRFLAGLSADELEFLAGFQGACILERGAAPSRARGDEGYGSRADGWCAADRDHKMIVLREYLARCGWGMP
jgi:hypothetical protein